jgi:hypothetical protein
LIAVPSLAMAAPDQNTNGNNNNNCRGGQWINGHCVYNNNNNNNGQWNNNGRHRDRDDRDDRDRDRDDRHDNGRHNGWNNPNNPHNGQYNNGQYNNGGYNNGQYNGGYNNGQYNGNGNWNYGRGSQLTGTVSSFSPYNLYLNNGVHVELHNGTVINPTGTNLTPGMRVRVIGARNSDGTFNANEIDVVGNSGNRYYR